MTTDSVTRPVFEPPQDQLVEIPPLLPVAREVEFTAVANPESAAHDEVARCVAGRLRPGMRIAVGVGSRGMSHVADLVRGTLAALREAGADPFIVPAMGSHAGAVAEGQAGLLAEYGITEAAMGVPIRATMDVVEVGRAGNLPLFLDTAAASADAVFPVNRVKAHTCFAGAIESGLSKMLIIGFGKQHGAQATHALGFDRMSEAVAAGARVHCEAGRVLGGLATVENPDGSVAVVRALRPDEIGRDPEADLLLLADRLLGRLPFEAADLLIVDWIGKTISGVGLDPNVTGRFGIYGVPDGIPGLAPRVGAIVAFGLTPESHGNAFGVGMADIIPVALAREIDWAAVHMNAFTGAQGGFIRAKLPLVVRDRRTAVRMALTMLGASDPARALVARIPDTGHVDRLWLSPALLDLSPGVERLAVLPGDPNGHAFLDEG